VRRLWIAALLLIGCSDVNRRYCDDQSPCVGARLVCDPRLNTCVPTDGGGDGP
jgi:hypothetical protein